MYFAKHQQKNSMTRLILEILVLILWLLFAESLLAQARIGYTEKQIKSEFANYNFKTAYTKDNTKYIYWEDADLISAYYLDNKNISYACIIVPKKQGILNYLVESYNKKYVIISETQWKMYNNNGIVNIELVFRDGATFIRFTDSN
jgi:hypothetical protein